MRRIDAPRDRSGRRGRRLEVTGGHSSRAQSEVVGVVLEVAAGDTLLSHSGGDTLERPSLTMILDRGDTNQ